MIKQSFINSDSILEKKFKILRMSIMLGNSRNREETIKEYEETAREIDKYKNSLYEEILSSKMYMTTTLEEERDRLSMYNENEDLFFATSTCDFFKVAPVEVSLAFAFA